MTVRRLCDLDFISAEDAEAEIEDFIFANNITEKEYCIDIIERSGMKRRLDSAQRRRVWQLRDRIVERMDTSLKVSRNYSRILLARAAAEENLAEEDFLFIDEVQDLSPADLMVLRAFTTGAIIMAGDNDQAIFRKGFSFKRAGIDIVGRSRTIKLNFRNTLQINELAEIYRKRSGSDEDESEKKAYERPCEAFRPGPPPELFRTDDTDGLEKVLIERLKILIDLLGYEPENIAVVTPDKAVAASLAASIRIAGIESVRMDAEGFSFASSRGIRVSTMHDMKGIDVPVVLLFLPFPPGSHGSFDEVFNEAILRNLIYVSMTRVMEYLAVFTVNVTPNPAIHDIVTAFDSFRLITDGT